MFVFVTIFVEHARKIGKEVVVFVHAVRGENNFTFQFKDEQNK